MSAKLFDTHVHFFDHKNQKDTSYTMTQLLETARENGVGWFCNVGLDLITSQKALNFARQHEGVFAAGGFHPTMVNAWDNKSLLALNRLCQDPKVVAIGEIGLDFYHQYTTPRLQKQVLHHQLALAQKLHKPVLLHIRDAYPDTLAIVKQYQVTGIVHCFSGTWEDAQAFIALGFVISFSGVLTFHNALSLQNIARKLPLQHLVVETDAPYLAPMPFRGKINLPQYLPYTAKKLANLKGIDYQEVVNQTTKNALKILKII